MNHNPNNVEKGQIVILDKEFGNSTEVFIQDFTPLKMYATVCCPENLYNTWQVMTCRLTPKEKLK